MSETLRTYTRQNPSRGFSISGRRRGKKRNVVLASAAIIFLASMFWISRDTNPVEEFIAADRGVHIVISDVMQERSRLARAAVWSTFPEGSMPANLPKVLGDNFGFPEWVLRNVVGGDLIVTGDSLADPGELLYLSRMTVVGCAIERAMRLRPGVAEDWAGGLRLHALTDSGLYYAVRGRIFIASASRRAIVGALTLAPDARLDAESIIRVAAEPGSESARGVVRLDGNEGLGRVFESILFAVQVDDSGNMRLRIEGALRPEWEDRLAESLGDSAPVELRAPTEGPLELSVNFGMPMKELWLTAGDLWDVEAMSERRWDEWARQHGAPTVERALTGLLGPAGPGLRLTWRGLDMNEMAPVPLLVGNVDAVRSRVTEFLEGLPPAPEGSGYHTAYAYYDVPSERFRAPLMSGPSLEPTTAWHGDGLTFSTSRILAESALGVPGDGARGSCGFGNLYLRARPLECVRIVTDAGNELAREGLLRNYTAEEYLRASARWLERASLIDEVTVLLTMNNRVADIELEIRANRK